MFFSGRDAYDLALPLIFSDSPFQPCSPQYITLERTTAVEVTVPTEGPVEHPSYGGLFCVESCAQVPALNGPT